MPSFQSSLAHTFPPKPQFTERDIPDLEGKVYIVTGSNTGIGKEVSRLLYSKNAKIYIAARSETKAQQAINDIKESAPSSAGSLVFLQLDLSDLRNVKAAAEKLLAQEQRLHSLFNNAGLMGSEPLQKTTQGYEVSLGVNCVGTFLFTKLLTPILAATAKAPLPSTVRVIWLSSFVCELHAHEGIGVSTDNLDYHTPVRAATRYSLSKAGVWALGVEYGRRHGQGKDGIVSVAINPGNLRSELQRDQGLLFKILTRLLLYPTINGAYTELYAAFSPEVVEADLSENWVGPFGRILSLRPPLPKATKPESEGGTGGTAKFWEWNEEQVKDYL
ncbi:putative estradiol 17 beta-dehydrogenase [Hypoxylon sp. FL0543]|nr:putative estradiol 17 beta-dehydrogenase [Hypoxylon sp. FL0543]